MMRWWLALVLAGPTTVASVSVSPSVQSSSRAHVGGSVEPHPPSVPAVTAPAVSPGSRTIPYHAHDVVALRAKVRFTTTIVLPEGEDIMEATCGDKEFWMVNARGPVASIKPAKPGSETNLTLLTTSGQLYAFRLTEISATKDVEPDLVVYLEPDDPAMVASWPRPPKYVPAEQVDDVRAQLAIAKDDARRATEAAEMRVRDEVTTFRRTYPLSLTLGYRFKTDVAPFFVHAIFHDDHVTYIQADARELPALYELKDGAPNLVSFDVRGGTYVVPKVLESGYLAIGKARFVFTRGNAR